MNVRVGFNSHKTEILGDLGDQVEAALEEMGLVGEGFAKLKCPVDTGNLRNSIGHDHDQDTAYIGTNVEYGPYVEMGTSRTRAQPFLQPAVENHVDVYRQIAINHMRN